MTRTFPHLPLTAGIALATTHTGIGGGSRLDSLRHATCFVTPKEHLGSERMISGISPRIALSPPLKGHPDFRDPRQHAINAGFVGTMVQTPAGPQVSRRHSTDENTQKGLGKVALLLHMWDQFCSIEITQREYDYATACSGEQGHLRPGFGEQAAPSRTEKDQ